MSAIEWDFPRGTNSVRLMTEFALEHGMSIEDCLAGTGIDEADLQDASRIITGQQEVMLAANVARGFPDRPWIGLEMGVRYHLTTTGVWGLAVMSSATVRDAITVGQRYIGLTYALFRPRFREEDDRLLLLMDEHMVPEPPRRMFLDRALTVFYHMFSQVLGEPPPVTKMLMRCPEPDYADRYDALFGIRPQFDAERTGLEFEASILDRPLPQADAHAARVSEAMCQEILDSRAASEGVAGEVRRILLRELARSPSMARVAKELATTPRSLRRRLDEEKVSFRELVNEVREKLAEELLSTAGLNVEEVSLRLGFANTAAFTSAFKRWKGVPPGAWRSTRPVFDPAIGAPGAS